MKWKIVEARQAWGPNGSAVMLVQVESRVVTEVREAVADVSDALASQGYRDRYHTALRNVMEAMLADIGADPVYLASMTAKVHQWFGLTPEGHRV